MKKHLVIIALFIVASTTFSTVNAQQMSVQQIENSIKKKGKYAILVQNSKHFMASVNTGERYKATSEKIRFEIVLIGEVVKDLAEKDELKPFVEKAEKSRVRIVVCEFAMDKLGVKKSDYHPSILTTPNGFTYLFGLQENGFKTIQL